MSGVIQKQIGVGFAFPDHVSPYPLSHSCFWRPDSLAHRTGRAWSWAPLPSQGLQNPLPSTLDAGPGP